MNKSVVLTGNIADSGKTTKAVSDNVISNGTGKINPLDDPKIAKDVVTDPDAVYGYKS